MHVGIDDIAVYIPYPTMPLELLVNTRCSEDSDLAMRLKRGWHATGQDSFHFPQPWEDTSTMAAQSSRNLLLSHPKDVSDIRYLVTGTESSVDMSKPVSSYVQGMLQISKIPLPNTLATFQVQHACAGGTYGILSVAAMLAASKSATEKGLITCSDIARYKSYSTAEITQGAGAVSVLLSKDPRLLEVNLQPLGYSSHDVDDFFRPVQETTARVKGQYSIECYNDALDSAIVDYCKQSGEDISDMLGGMDYFVLHIPFYKMGYLAMRRMLRKYLSLSDGKVDAYLDDRGFSSTVKPIARVGNIYTGSIYLSLMFLMKDRYEIEGRNIIGRRILIASYGSGNTMAVFSGTIAADAPDIISSWDLKSIFERERTSNMTEYTAWLQNGRTRANLEDVPDQHYYLSSIRDDGYREYKFKS